MRAAVRNHDLLLNHAIFRAAAILDRELPRWEKDGSAVFAVDLLLEEEVWSNTLRLRRIDAARGVAEHQPGGGRLAVMVPDSKFDGDRRPNIEKDRGFAAESEVLCSLPDVEGERGLSFARFAAVNERDRIFDPEAAQLRCHGRRREHLDLQKSSRLAFDVLVLLQMNLPLPFHAQLSHSGIYRSGLRASDPQRRCSGTQVNHL